MLLVLGWYFAVPVPVRGWIPVNGRRTENRYLKATRQKACTYLARIGIMMATLPTPTPTPGVKTQIPILSVPDIVQNRLPTEFDPKKDLTPEQLTMLEEFRAQLPELLISRELIENAEDDDEDMAQLTDEEIAEIRKEEEVWTDDAFDRLEATLKWRRTYKPHKITPDDIVEESLTGKIYVNGFDQIGRPILYLCPKRENTKNHDQQLKHTVFVMETAIKMMSKGVEQVIIAIDYEGVSMRTAPPLAITRRFLDTIGAHYPERMGIGFVVNPSWYLWIALGLASPFMDPVTKAKINFVSLSGKANKSKESTADGTGSWTSLQKYIDNELLDAMFGGDYAFEWHHPTYWSYISALRSDVVKQ
ncbi:hypothetical protein SmJEL517_g00131 [Synchytrium microbalum]|uniref:CRAL-TRIO domain-containing protein n=1 Tax=Synchytrium microbalum TaxID=1806994 RepID=A0A507C9P9_9FUNG|nr:uncharacterized protein SmJEL517_g00131 [Synchytrium microbalum]TPX38310.1 hypothetical protein SmJEL517_g00131 [Synchytrium microbalum]